MSREPLPDRSAIERAAGLSFGTEAEPPRRPHRFACYEWSLILSLAALGGLLLWIGLS